MSAPFAAMTAAMMSFGATAGWPDWAMMRRPWKKASALAIGPRTTPTLTPSIVS